MNAIPNLIVLLVFLLLAPSSHSLTLQNFEIRAENTVCVDLSSSTTYEERLIVSASTEYADLTCVYDDADFGPATPIDNTKWSCPIPKSTPTGLFSLRANSVVVLNPFDVTDLIAVKPCVVTIEQSKNNCVGSVYQVSFTGKTIVSALDSFLVCAFSHSTNGNYERAPVTFSSDGSATCATSASSEWVSRDSLLYDSVMLETAFSHQLLAFSSLSLPANVPCADFSSSSSNCAKAQFKVELSGQSIDFYSALEDFQSDDQLGCSFLDAKKLPLDSSATSDFTQSGLFSCSALDVSVDAKYVSFTGFKDAVFEIPSAIRNLSACLDVFDSETLATKTCENKKGFFPIVFKGDSVEYFAQGQSLSFVFVSNTGNTISSPLSLSGDELTGSLPFGLLASQNENVRAYVRGSDLKLGAYVGSLPACTSASSVNGVTASSGSDNSVVVGVSVSFVLILVALVVYLALTPRHSRWCKNKIATLPSFVVGDHATTSDVEKIEASIKKIATMSTGKPVSDFASSSGVESNFEEELRETIDLDRLGGWGWTLSRLFTRERTPVMLDDLNFFKSSGTSVSLGEDRLHVRVEFDPREGFGTILGRTSEGRVVIASFSDLPKADKRGALETSSAAWVRDQVVEIDGTPVHNLTPTAKLVEVVRAAGRKSRVCVVLRSEISKKQLGYGAFQVLIPRGCRLGLEFEGPNSLVVSKVYQFSPLRNAVSVGSKLTAIDGKPVLKKDDVYARIEENMFEIQTIRLRFVAATVTANVTTPVRPHSFYGQPQPAFLKSSAQKSSSYSAASQPFYSKTQHDDLDDDLL